MIGADDAGTRDQWVDAFTTSDIQEDEAHEILQGHADDHISHFDFEVSVKGQVATLTVTKESLKSTLDHPEAHASKPLLELSYQRQLTHCVRVFWIAVFQKGKMIAEHKIKTIKSWSVGPEKIIFKLNEGGAITIDTKVGSDIKDALVNQAKGIIQAQKDAKAAKAEEAAAAEETAAAAAAAEAEEALRWLTYDELRTGNYERYTGGGSRQGDIDEKNKELLLSDAEFETVFGMSKEAFAKKPAFQKPLTKKKLGLGPYQFNE